MRWLYFLAAMGVWSCTGTPEAESVPQGGRRARLEIFVPDTSADNPHARPVDRPFDMVLTNLSKRPLWVSSDIRHDGPSPTQGIVEITGPSGPIHEICKACGGTSPAYRALAPGEQMRVHSELGCFGWFLEPGVYTARAIYSPTRAAKTYFVYGLEGRGGPPPPPEGVDLLTEDVVSDAVQFRVRALTP